jgi:hypothetical protein
MPAPQFHANTASNDPYVSVTESTETSFTLPSS